MYQLLMRINRYFSVIAAAVLLLALTYPPLQNLLGLNTVAGLVIYSAVLAGTVLADKRLAKLSFDEVCRQTAGVSLEEATEKFWKEELQRRRDEVKSNR